jgi:hypothetical protein
LLRGSNPANLAIPRFFHSLLHSNSAGFAGKIVHRTAGFSGLPQIGPLPDFYWFLFLEKLQVRDFNALFINVKFVK